MRKLLLLIVFLSLTQALPAEDVFVLGARSQGATLPGSTAFIRWDADTSFHNLGATEATIRRLGVSNGFFMVPGTKTEFSIPPGRSTTTAFEVGPLFPDATPLWITHFDVPPEVFVDSALLPALVDSAGAVPPTIQLIYGKTSLPVWRSLTPAHQRQVHTGISLGELPSHINVGVYNAGTSQAQAIVEVYRACDDRVIDARTVTVPPDTVIQFGGFDASLIFNGCPPERFGFYGLGYVIVTVDQPSLSFTSIVVDGQLPISGVQVSGGR
ncbi:MAG: hypothetical protein ABI718_07140 [Acidobacteriota bacterium]